MLLIRSGRGASCNTTSPRPLPRNCEPSTGPLPTGGRGLGLGGSVARKQKRPERQGGAGMASPRGSALEEFRLAQERGRAALEKERQMRQGGEYPSQRTLWPPSALETLHSRHLS